MKTSRASLIVPCVLKLNVFEKILVSAFSCRADLHFEVMVR